MQKNIQYSVEQLDAVVEMCKDFIRPGMIITLTGLLGAGKTTFVSHVCASFGVMQPVVSPTYSYVSIYSLQALTIYHFDLYRIDGIEEFEALGFVDYLDDPRGIVLVEWPERIAALLERPSYRDHVFSLMFKYLPENAELRELFLTLPRSA